MACGKAGREKGHADHLCLNCAKTNKYGDACAEACMNNGECLFEPVGFDVRLLVRPARDKP